MIHQFNNQTPVTIDAADPNTIRSTIDVADIEGRLRDVNVSIDVDHTYTNDLTIALIGPTGERVVLVEKEGGSGNNFRSTQFDDAATDSIIGARPPFSGQFRPEESLTAFNDTDPNGTWTLEIVDSVSLDGGTLNSWTLSLETGRFIFENTTSVTIDPGGPNTVTSTIDVNSVGGLVIDDIDVTVDIEHTWDSDLILTLISPSGQRVLLVGREGGSADDFRNTTFDDAAQTSIADASAPFSGRFQPEGSLADFNGTVASGVWTLEIEDTASQDGGMLNSWSLSLTGVTAEPPASAFTIEVRFLGGLTANQRSVFELAAARWSELIVGNLPSVLVEGELIDDVVIEAQGVAIDGRGSILGQAGPTHLRPGSFLPARGIMSFDTADLAALEADGGLINVIIHEMGHVLGIGTIWSRLGFLQGAGSINPTFVGGGAMEEYGVLLGTNISTPVPVANTGGPGTRDGHWRESVFGNELMTGFLDAAENPISRMTVASLEDLGYTVDRDAADPYAIPTALELAAMGIGALEDDHGGHGVMFIPDQVVLPESALADEE